jgi:hypothetical protein
VSKYAPDATPRAALSDGAGSIALPLNNKAKEEFHEGNTDLRGNVPAAQIASTGSAEAR